MNIKKLTVMFIGLLMTATIGYDVYAILKGGTEASVSYTIYMWSYKYPIFTFACGVLAGHFFWRIRDTKGTKQISDDSRK